PLSTERADAVLPGEPGAPLPCAAPAARLPVGDLTSSATVISTFDHFSQTSPLHEPGADLTILQKQASAFQALAKCVLRRGASCRGGWWQRVPLLVPSDEWPW